MWHGERELVRYERAAFGRDRESLGSVRRGEEGCKRVMEVRGKGGDRGFIFDALVYIISDRRWRR